MTRPGAIAVGAVLAALVLPAGSFTGVSSLALAAAVVIAALGATGALPIGRAATWRFAVAGLAGALAVAVRLAFSQPSLDVALPSGSGPWHTVVESISAPRDGRQPAILRLADEDIRLAATLPRLPAIEPGDHLVVEGALKPPGDDAFGEYLGRIGVAGTIYSRRLDVDTAARGDMDLERLRRGASEALGHAIPEPEAGLAAGIVIGLRDRVDRDLAAAFTTAGASHVVAISGWNIAIVAASVASLGGRLAHRRRSLLTVVAISGYVVFVGASPSVLRAAVMAGVVLLARESGRAGRASAALGWAASAILIVDPSLVRDPGFQLSTLATAGLLAWSGPIGLRLTGLARGRAPDLLVEGLAVSLAAQFATMPVVLASFGRISLVAPLVSLAVVPLVAPAMAAAGIALAGGALVGLLDAPAAVATLAGLPAWLLLALIVGAVRLAAAIPFASMTLEPPLDTAVALVTGGVVAAIGFRSSRDRLVAAIGRALVGRSKRRTVATRPASPSSRRAQSRIERTALFAVVAALVWTLAVITHRPSGHTRIVVLDVGQGDAILVEGSRGGRMLVDGGPDPDRLLVALDQRLPPWDRAIQALVLTHPHEDHAAGLALLLAHYRVDRVYEPGMRGPGPGYAAWSGELAARGTLTGRLATGDRLALDDTRLTVLWPDRGSVPVDPPDTGTGINNVSIVLLGEVSGRRFLLAGDIEEEIDPILVSRRLPHVDVLKVAHHGSRTSSTTAFLDAVRPSVAVVSAGLGNPYGHPAPATIGRLKAHGAEVFRTDQDGSVEIAVDADRVTARSSSPRVRAALSNTVTSATTPAAALRFVCGIVRGGDPQPATASTLRASFVPRGAVAFVGPRPERGLLYDQVDVGPRARGSGGPPPLGRAAAKARQALSSCRRDRGVARSPYRWPRQPRRSPARRVGRAPPRRRQGLAAR